MALVEVPVVATQLQTEGRRLNATDATEAAMEIPPTNNSPPEQIPPAKPPILPPPPPSNHPPPPIPPPQTPVPSWVLANLDVIKAHSFPAPSDIVTRIHDACDSREPLRLTTANRVVLEALAHGLAPGNLDARWMDATARLCRMCREEGRLDEAAELLYRLSCGGPLQESDYLNFEPFQLIEALLDRNAVNQDLPELCAANVDRAVNLFVPKLTTRLEGANVEASRVGRRLLEACFASDELKRVFAVYRRCILVADGNWNDFASWFLTNLHKKEQYSFVIDHFLTTFIQSGPTEESIHAIGDLVIDSLESSGDRRIPKVLEKLQEICAGLGTTKMNPTWVMKLLVLRWRKHRKFKEVEAMFEKLQIPGLQDAVYRWDNVYRVMVELALESGDDVKAEAYFDMAVAQNPALASDVRLLGVIARFHAVCGDWQAVRADFEAMSENGKSREKWYSRVFVPVLKSFAETHSVRETEAFLRTYKEELGVPLCSYTVTLMAKQYGVIHDLASLIEWLDYCSRSGFPVDAAFTNAILVRCRRQWKFPFRDLRTLFRKLRVLNPDWVDGHTSHVMTDAALADSRYRGRPARGRVLSLRLDNASPQRRLAMRTFFAQKEGVVSAMKHALLNRSPRRALALYARAVRKKVPFSPYALQLAIQAQLRLTPDDLETAYAFIQKAQAHGHDTTSVINHLIAQQLTNLKPPPHPEYPHHRPHETDEVARNTLTAYHNAGVHLTPTSLHRAATICLQAHHFHAAILYARAAADAHGSPPCFDLPNFRLLLLAHAELADVDQLRDTLDRGLAPTSPYREARATRRALRLARARIVLSEARWYATPDERAQAHALVEEGLERVIEMRKTLREDGKKLEIAAVEIMRRAARDAGLEEVDFGEVAWLGGGEENRERKRERERERELKREMMEMQRQRGSGMYEYGYEYDVQNDGTGWQADTGLLTEEGRSSDSGEWYGETDDEGWRDCLGTGDDDGWSDVGGSEDRSPVDSGYGGSDQGVLMEELGKKAVGVGG
ncbi:hypothetical protein B0J18DRAFT_418779 [Chaetomium sp. MPI-SDFR-AT-0129]|nr:hypothetical protein B0J18DRAFT_418779 [Chaetomium sp. MPI-SDFR-AT-0129]